MNLRVSAVTISIPGFYGDSTHEYRCSGGIRCRLADSSTVAIRKEAASGRALSARAASGSERGGAGG